MGALHYAGFYPQKRLYPLISNAYNIASVTYIHIRICVCVYLHMLVLNYNAHTRTRILYWDTRLRADIRTVCFLKNSVLSDDIQKKKMRSNYWRPDSAPISRVRRGYARTAASQVAFQPIIVLKHAVFYTIYWSDNNNYRTLYGMAAVSFVLLSNERKHGLGWEGMRMRFFVAFTS